MEIPLLVWLFIGTVSAFIAAVFVIGSLIKKVFHLRSKILGMSTRHGMMVEQLLPLSKDFPGDPQKFKFLGAPTDGILFDV